MRNFPLSIQDLTIHEGVPGHYLQLALSNRYPSTLRSVFWSGPFVEGWAVYAEKMMVAEGYMNHDPLMKLINLKWYLRAVTNAIIDPAIHVDGMTREAAMKLMIEGGFQEEREADGKWVRAQLTSAQLSTYLVGYQEHLAMRAAVEERWGTYWEGAQASAAFTGGGSSDPLILTFWRNFFSDIRGRGAKPKIIDIASGNGAVVASANAAFDGQLPEFSCLDISASAIRVLEERFPGVRGIHSGRMHIELSRRQLVRSL